MYRVTPTHFNSKAIMAESNKMIVSLQGNHERKLSCTKLLLHIFNSEAIMAESNEMIVGSQGNRERKLRCTELLLHTVLYSVRYVE